MLMTRLFTASIRLLAKCLATKRQFLASTFALAGLVLTGCGGSAPNEPELQAAPPGTSSALAVGTVTPGVVTGVSVEALVLKAERRISRTVFEYDYQITLSNQGPALSNVVVQLTAAGAGTTIVDGTVNAGSLAANSVTTPADGITIRHDRMLPFNQAAFVWQIGGTSASAVPGILLPGSPSDNAAAGMQDYSAHRSEDDLALITEASSGIEYYLTQLIVSISEEATVGEVNAALSAVGARVVFSQLKNPVVTLQVPAPPSLDALRAVAERLRASGAFAAVSPLSIPQTEALPPGITSLEAVAAGGPLIHHIGVRLPQAWNALAAKASSDVEVIVIDRFGARCCARDQFGNRFQYSHGRHVSGILAAPFGGPRKVVGVLQEDLVIHEIDLDLYKVNARNWLDYIRTRLALIFSAAPSKRFVINISLGYKSSEKGGFAEGSWRMPAVVRDDAIEWRDFVRNIWVSLNSKFDYESRTIQVSAAGNNAGAIARSASSFNAAVLFGTLRDAKNRLVPRLTNGIVVENRTVNPGQQAIPEPGCLYTTNNLGGGSNIGGISNIGDTVGAIGTNVWSVATSSSAGLATGTSMASPQVAGLAASLWALNPELTSAEARSAVVVHASDEPQGLNCKDNSNQPINGRPIIDAYQTILAADDTQVTVDPQNPYRPPVRRAILDLNEDGRFDYDDAKAFVDVFVTHRDKSSLAEPPTTVTIGSKVYDLSRFDLNGDGKIGGAGTGRFNLDVNYDTAQRNSIYSDISYRTNPQSSGIFEPIAKVNEEKATDTQILCYHVFSQMAAEFDSGYSILWRENLDGYLAMRTGSACDVPPVLRTTAITCTSPSSINISGIASGATGTIFPGSNAAAKRITASCGSWSAVRSTSNLDQFHCRREPSQPDSTAWSMARMLFLWSRASFR
jgi:hypothetical protein